MDCLRCTSKRALAGKPPREAACRGMCMPCNSVVRHKINVAKQTTWDLEIAAGRCLVARVVGCANNSLTGGGTPYRAGSVGQEVER